MLVNTEVFKKMERPWFAFKYHESGMCEEGEDWYFCRKAKEMGYEVWCNPTISIKHIGEKEY